jgi:hypothetical protein
MQSKSNVYKANSLVLRLFLASEPLAKRRQRFAVSALLTVLLGFRLQDANAKLSLKGDYYV